MISIWTWICSIIPKKAMGILTKIIFESVSSVIISSLLDKNTQKAAYNFVKELNLRKDLTNLEKAEIFNKKLLSWCLERGKEIKESVINALREWAVVAVKREQELQKQKKK